MAFGLVVVPAALGEHAELVVAVGHAGLVAEPFFDVEGALVVAFGLVVVPAVPGEDAEPVVDEGHAGLVAEPFADVQGALVLAGGLVVVPAPVSHDAELAEPDGLAGGSVWQPGQGVMDQGGFLVPGSPGMQLLQIGQVIWVAASVSPAASRWWRASSRSCMSAAWSCGQVWYRHCQ